MKTSFYIVDDDYGIRTILGNIIEDYELGVLIGESEDGLVAVDQITKLKPDIALIDLLLPNIDGIEVIKKAKLLSSDTQFIMISEVTSSDMVSAAYRSGVEFYVNKPINVIEVVSITRKAIESQKNMRVLQQIGQTLNYSNTFAEASPNSAPKVDTKSVTSKIFTELGIMGEAGCKDLMNLIDIIINKRKESGETFHTYNMSELYAQLNSDYKEEKLKSSITVKAIEQRIRRTIQTALQNIANIGSEDFGNYKFEKYSTSVFDFKEVKSEMDYIRGKSKYRGKINAKTFIEGIINLINT